jgi:hypothetical protein
VRQEELEVEALEVQIHHLGLLLQPLKDLLTRAVVVAVVVEAINLAQQAAPALSF